MSYYNKQIKFDCPSNFPKVEHLAIIVFDSIHIEGDERSRTNPGHGYPAYNKSIINYYAYALMDREYWLEHIQELMGIGKYVTKKNFVALDKGVMVTPQIKVSIET